LGEDGPVQERQIYDALCWGMAGVATVIFVVLLRVTAPYGRHTRAGWGPQLRSTIGWIVMESPAVLAFAAIYALGEHRAELAPLVLLGLWELHYVYRAFVFPLLRRGGDRPMPLAVVGFAILFNLPNAYLNARSLSHFAIYSAGWLTGPRFLVGATLFLVGFAIHVHADGVLRRLRAPGEREYKIPHGGLYRWLSCPNYFGELIEWTGWAIATWSIAGALFAFWTAANLVPRAVSNHRWYRGHFPDYPATRRAILPFIY
jgi:hypothetical protein